MTTKVIIKNDSTTGYVAVMKWFTPESTPDGPSTRLPPGESMEVHVHKGSYVQIFEVGP